MFLSLIILGIALRLFFVFTTPLYPEAGFLPGYNDEPLHLNYIQHLANGNGWPVYQPTGDIAIDHPRGEFVQPPLYYKSVVPAYKIGEFFRPGWGLYTVRLMSVLYGIIAGVFAYRMAYIWTNRRRIARFTLAAMMFAPNAVMFTSLVSNDALLICLSSMTLYSLPLCRQPRISGLRIVITGAFLAATMWVKLSAIVLVPLIVFCVPPKTTLKNWFVTSFKIFAIFALIVMPMIIWSVANYGHPYPGGGVPMQAQYLPEAAIGVSGGAIHHPLMATKIFLRTASMPIADLWGSALEKIISAIWLLIWGIFLIVGTTVSVFKKNLSYMFVAAVTLMTAAFIFRSVFLFQVEFRLYAPIFAILSILTALGYERLNLPLWLYAIIWSAPFAIIPFA